MQSLGPGVEYYLGDRYRTTGETYADEHNLGNKHPVVYPTLRGRAAVYAFGRCRLRTSVTESAGEEP
jgi:hypothetical protein